ncbi:MAG TPA: sulfite exporter TauE/SafE family protein [Chloroflexota bacterium]|nr:sulfite exporter TauE/SafE family protein [Chloroflexota bacterium]
MLFAPHAIVFAASIAATVTGYGFVLLSSPLLLFLFSPREVVPLTLLLSWLVILSLVIRPTVWQAMDRGQVLRLVAGGVCGIPFGTAILATLDPHVLRISLGVVITLLALVTLFSAPAGRAPLVPLPVWRARSPSIGRAGNPLVVSGTSAWLRSLGAGFLGGILSGSSGLGGSLVVLYLARRGMDKHQLRATSAAVIWAYSTVTLTVYSLTGNLPANLGWSTLFLIPSLAAGRAAGNIVFSALPDRRFRQVSLSLAAAAGAMTALAGILANGT